MAILEAMACGVPTVAWDLPVYREVFTAGLVRIPPLRCNAFAETVIGLLQDADRRAAVRLEAMEIVPRYDWRQVVAREMSLIRKAVAAARSDLLPSLEGGAE
jgi:glycosyltransferase involved in cell wall biosynthesis